MALPVDDEWMARCCERLLQLDPLLPRTEVMPIVTEMSGRTRWRGMAPEAAAERVFVPHPARRADAAAARPACGPKPCARRPASSPVSQPVGATACRA